MYIQLGIHMRYFNQRLILIGLFVATTVDAIVIRHDVVDTKYQVVNEDYPYVVSLGGGTGVVIQPQWILTAAHVAKYITRGTAIEAAGIKTTVQDIFLHPNNELLAPHTWDNDIALIRTQHPIALSDYPKLYRDTDQEQQVVTFLGFGGI